eukprot:2421489-Pyramimonas_sp.AAC.1
MSYLHRADEEIGFYSSVSFLVVGDDGLGAVHVGHLLRGGGHLGRLVVAHAQEAREAQRDALVLVHPPARRLVHGADGQ